MEWIYPEIDSAFHVKVMLCFILDRIDRPVSEEHFYEIVRESGVINYFHYAGALAELIENGSVSKDGGDLILNEKGRMGAEYFNAYIPEFFRGRLLKSASLLFSRITRESETDISAYPVPNGFEVSCAIKDVSYDLMRISLYAPDGEQANIIKDKILKNPAMFYRRVVEYALDNSEDENSV